MKKLQWFKVNEEIPTNSTFIKSGKIQTGIQTIDIDPYGSTEEHPIYEEQYLYEINTIGETK